MPCRTPRWFWALLAVAACGGCSPPSNPWTFYEPPAVQNGVFARQRDPSKPVIAIATFKNPDVPQLSWPDVGLVMTKAMRRAILNDGEFEVRIEPELERVVSNPAFLLGGGGDVKPDGVDFVMTGHVTDFHHTAPMHKDVRRWSFAWRRSEAVVAIDWKVIDVHARRVIAADHIYGQQDASRKPVEEIYAGLDATAYLFWNTPLGKAAHRAVDRTLKRMKQLLPQHVGSPVIAKVKGNREVSVTGGWTWGLARGQEYYVCVPQGDVCTPVYDVDTGNALAVRIDRVSKDTSTAYLHGKPPPDVDLRGAALSTTPPPPADDLAATAPDAVGHGDGGT